MTTSAFTSLAGAKAAQMEPVDGELASMEPADAVRCVTQLAHAIQRGDGKAEATGRTVLPSSLKGLAPEVQVALAHMVRAADETLALLEGLPRSHEDDERTTWPRWPLPVDWTETAPAVQVLWRRILWTRQPTLIEDAPDVQLRQCMAGWRIDALANPLPLLKRCCREDASPSVALEGLRRAKEAVRHTAIPPAELGSLLLSLGAHEDSQVRVAVLASLTEPVARATLPSPVALLEKALDASSTPIVLAAIRCAESWQATGLLRELLRLDEGDAPSPRTAVVKAAAIRALASCGDHQAMAEALACGLTAPATFGPATRFFFEGLHRRGLFPREAHLLSLLRLFDEDASWNAEAFARITFTCRETLCTQLQTLPAQDARWRRRAALLAHLEVRSADALIATCLRQAKAPRVVEGLLQAAAMSPAFADEDALLSHLDTHPVSALHALWFHGGEKTVQVLSERLRNPFTFGASRPLAIRLAFALSTDRRPLLEQLDVRELPAGLVTCDLGDDVLVPRLLARQENPTPLKQLQVLARHGDQRHLADARRWFREVISNHTRGEVAPNLEHAPWDRWDEQAALERAILDYGARLYAQGARVAWTPRVDASQAGVRESGAPQHDTRQESAAAKMAFLQHLLFEWIEELLQDENRASDPLLPALLERFGATLHTENSNRKAPLTPRQLRGLHRLWRHGDPQVRAAGMALLVDADVVALELSLCSGADSRTHATAADHRTVRQGLRAIQAFEAHWAEPYAIAAMGHPNMNIKKTAAETLSVVGSVRCIGTVLDWLAAHDNPGLRQLLLQALDHAAGVMATALLLQRLEETQDPKHQQNLLNALSGRLSFTAAMRRWQKGLVSGASLRTAVRNGTVRLQEHDGTVDLKEEWDTDALRRALFFAETPENGKELHKAVNAIAQSAETSPLENALDALNGHPFTAERADALMTALGCTDGSRKEKTEPSYADLFAPDGSPQAIFHEDSHLRSRIEETIRRHGPAWLTWAAADTAEHKPPIEAVCLGIRATTDAIASPAFFRCIERLNAPPYLSLAMEALGRFTGQPAPRRMHALQALRTRPTFAGGGAERLKLLTTLGGVLTRQDLEQALADARQSTDTAKATRAVLHAAFHIGAQSIAWAEQGPSEATSNISEDQRLALLVQTFPSVDEGTQKERLQEINRVRPLGLKPLPHSKWDDTSLETGTPTDTQTNGELIAIPRLRTALHHPKERARAATLALRHPETHHLWPEILDLWLARKLEDATLPLARLAPLLPTWPDEEPQRSQAIRLVPHLATYQVDAYFTGWLEAREAGATWAEEALVQRSARELADRLTPQLERNASAWVPLIRRARWGSGPAFARLKEELQRLAPDAFPEEAPHAEQTVNTPSSAEEWCDFIRARRGPTAARAVGRLTTFGEAAIAPLVGLQDHKDGQVRNAVLRALRKVAPRQRYLEFAHQMLAREAQSPLQRRLIRVLGHGRHLPALKDLCQLLTHRNGRVANEAHKALLLFGDAALPALHKARSRARPDKVKHYDAVVTAIEDAA